MKTMFCFAVCLWETHFRRTNSSNVVGSPKRAEKVQTINHIFKDSLFRTNADVFMINVPILQSRLCSRHNPDIRDFKKRNGRSFLRSCTSNQEQKKSDSFAAHLEQYFNTNTSRIYLRKYMTFKVEKQLNPIGTIKILTKPNCNLCMEERLTILKRLCDKHITILNKNLEIYGACRHKTIFRQFCLSTHDIILTGERLGR